MATALNCFSLLKQRSTVLRRPPGQRLTAQPGPALSTIARAGKYAPLVPALRELILRPDTPLATDVKDMIVGRLDTAQARFAAIRHGPLREQRNQPTPRRSSSG